MGEDYGDETEDLVSNSHSRQLSNDTDPLPVVGNDLADDLPLLHPTGYQSACNLSLILAVPPSVLSQLARAADRNQQQRIILGSRLDPLLLSIMSLPAPQPSSSFQRQQHSKHHLADQPSNNLPLSDSSNILVETSVNLPSSPSSAPTTSSSTSSSFFSHGKLSSSLPPSNPSAITHPAIPHILHQLFSPNSAVILAPVTDDCPRAHEYQPTYRSVDEWAIQVAQQAAAVTAIDHQFTSYIASQLKTWALYSQDSQLEHVVKKTKHCAILLAARADAALRKVSSTASSSSRDTTNPPSPFSAPEHISNRLDQGSITNDSHQNSVLSLDHKTPSNGKTNHQALPDHTPYANAYKSQLVTVAAGYYTHLHREAINMLDQSSSTSTSSLLTSDHIISYNNNNSNINNTTSSSSSNSNINSNNNNNNNNNNNSSSSRTIRNRGIHHHKHSLHPNHHQFDPNCSQVPHSFLGLPEIQSQQQYPPNHPHLPQYFNQQHISDSHQPSVPTNSHSSPYNHHQHLRSSHPSHLLSSQLQHPLTSLSIPNSASLSLPSPSAINGYHTSAPNMTNTNFNGNQKPPSSPYKDLRTRNVQAAAVAALTANAMAATEIASHAGQTLSNLGMTIHADLTTPLPPSGPAAIAATQRTLELAQGLQPNQSLHTSSLEVNPALISQAVINTTPLPTSQQQEVILHRNLNGSISGNLRNLSTSPHPLSSSLITLGAHQALPQPNRPSYRNDNHPANSYANQVERMWRMAQEGQCTDQARDQLLSFAHMTYSKKTSDPCLLPLLHTLARLHPNHLPTLLLLSCVYYSQGDYVSALYYNDQILSIDPDYVEAMSNMGTTQRALGRSAEAEELWWRAITIRPTYLDAFDNLIGVLCNSHSASSSNPQVQGQPRFAEALRLCKFVEAALFGPEELQFRPVRLPSIIPVTDAHRVQNLFYAKGNLLTATNRAALAHEEYVKALEVVLGPPMPKSVSVQDSDTEGYSLVDLVLAVTSIGIFMTALNASETGAPTDPAVLRSLSNTGIWDPNFCGVETVLADPLKAARQRRNVVRNRLLRMGGGILPCVLLLPESLDQLVSTVFSASSRALPVFQNYLTPQSSGGQAFPTRNAAFQSPNHTTSHLLLNMARYLQDASSFSSPGGVAASLDGIPPSPSLLLPLYYVAITLHPSPSTCNNLGILISTIPSSLTIYKRNEGRRVLSAQHVAHTYYIQGLQKDDRHPHLYTNLGSLLKDMGQLPQAVMMYDKAVQFNPNFDVALANLANAIKDMGRVQESVQWYKKAVVINPNFPEAVCGLVNALGGVCDWRDRGAVGNEPVVDVNGKLLGPPAPAPDGKLRAGLMGKVSRLVDRQLDEGISYGKGIMRQVAGLEQWLEAIAIIKTGRSDGSTTELRKRWRKKLEPFFGNLGEARSNTSRGAKFNEGGFLIRLIEQCTRQIQRRMYRDAYGTNLTSTSCTPKVNVSTERKGGTTSSYQRLTLPMALPAPPVPTVLPFHTFTYPLTARECRLISHRNALKISLTTLNQPWIPSAAYPPPPPPFPTDPDGLPRLRVGYVSSDFNNHPLAHLTQSVFGLHDQSRFKIFCYATSTSDDSIYRKKIQDEVEVFKDISTWSCERAVNEIVKDHIHILVNLNGYTKGAKNEVFAARPCPIQMEYMGFAGTLASGWTDWIIADPVVCPPRMVSGEKWRKRHHISHAETHDASTLANSLDRENLPRFLELEDDGPTDFEGHLDPESVDEDWVYTEKFIYMPHSYFVCDHKQGFRDEATQTTTALNGVPINLNLKFNTDEDESHKRNRAWEEEEVKRWAMRKETFPDIDDRTIIFANFNQLYKIDPLVFNYWLEILAAVPNSILWLLRFPAPGEPHLKMTAEKWAGKEVASRIRFTDVASKPIHIQRGRVADLFLDSTECNAHTTAADILWSATPILTLPRPTHAHKMCSRVATSIALATGYGLQMIATSMEDYKNRAINFASTLSYQLKRTQSGVDYRSGEVVPGGLIELRQNLFFSREKSVLFDTARWTKNLEKGYLEAWRRFVLGLDDEESVEWNNCQDSGLKGSCSIWLKDEEEDECVRRVNMARQEFMIRENQLTGSNDPTI